jgi:hypothetical protein
MEINLLSKYPRTKRDLKARSGEKTNKVRIIARKFGQDFFDGDRKYGYGGFNYGCAKGFMLYDLSQHLPLNNLSGIDVSSYAIENALPEVRDIVSIGDAKDLSQFDNNEFDLVISINTVHNLKLDECRKALQEIERVGQNKFITVDAWRTDEEKEAMLAWNLTANTMMSVNDWERFFRTSGYTGDYYWFMP